MSATPIALNLLWPTPLHAAVTTGSVLRLHAYANPLTCTDEQGYSATQMLERAGPTALYSLSSRRGPYAPQQRSAAGPLPLDERSFR
jgi:hypothetical protein